MSTTQLVRPRQILKKELFASTCRAVRERIKRWIRIRLARSLARKLAPIPVTVATRNSQRAEAFGLVYREYRKRQICPERSSAQHFSHFAILPTSATLVMLSKGRLAGTVTVIKDSPLGLPLEALFPDELRDLRTAGAQLAEVSLLALDHSILPKRAYSLKSVEKMHLLFSLFGGLFALCLTDQDIRDLVVVVHPRHAEIYELLGFRAIGPVKSYGNACGKPALPMHAPMTEVIRHALNLGTNEYLTNIYASEAGSGESALDLLFENASIWNGLSQDTQISIHEIASRQIGITAGGQI